MASDRVLSFFIPLRRTWSSADALRDYPARTLHLIGSDERC